MGWRLLVTTGMRRGEALALRWRDVDLDAGRLAVRRSVGVVKKRGRRRGVGRRPHQDRPIPHRRPGRGQRGSAPQVPDGPRPADPRPRPGLRARAERARQRPLAPLEILPPLRRPGPPSAQGAGGGALPVIRLHDLRHTHATCCLPTACRATLCRSAWAMPAPPSHSPSTSTCTPAWAARRPTVSPHRSRADPDREASRGHHECLGTPTRNTPGSWGDRHATRDAGQAGSVDRFPRPGGESDVGNVRWSLPRRSLAREALCASAADSAAATTEARHRMPRCLVSIPMAMGHEGS